MSVEYTADSQRLLNEHWERVHQALETGKFAEAEALCHQHTRLLGSLAKVPKLNLRERLAERLPPLLKRASPRAFPSPTTPVARRTFGPVEPWPEFLDEALELANTLDTTARIYSPGGSSVGAACHAQP